MVEDEIKLSKAVRRALELQKYAVDAVYDGQTGLDLAVGEKYDLIILDLMLPKMDGLAICRQIRKEGIDTPVLILTAKGQVNDKVKGLDAGADDYLVKPFSFAELFARVRALVRRGIKNGSPVLKVGNLTLDPQTFKVKRARKEIRLSAKEFAILEYLMRHQGAVKSREQIVQSVWDYDADVLPSTVEVHLKHLRDKIDVPFKTKLIKTVRGFGYEISDKD